jgi:hypothetical protein
MSEIKVSPTAQFIGLSVVAAAVAAAIAAQLPELKRYMKIRSM